MCCNIPLSINAYSLSNNKTITIFTYINPEKQATLNNRYRPFYRNMGRYNTGTKRGQ